MKKMLILVLSAVLFSGCSATEKNARHDFYLNGWTDNKHFAIAQSNILIDDSEESALAGGSMFGPLGDMVTSALGVVNEDDPDYQAKVNRFYQNTLGILQQRLKDRDIKLSEAKVGAKVLGSRSWVENFFRDNPSVPYAVIVDGQLQYNANRLLRKPGSAANLEKTFAVSYQWHFYDKQGVELMVVNTQHVGKVSGYLTYESPDFDTILTDYQQRNIDQLVKVLSNVWDTSNGKKVIQAWQL